ncbi:MAG TPA: M48 family metalloprotease [Planctomycetota bacterium]|nr:M48 family metalloprotease [Planctomycetota bacterium]
MFTLRSPRRLLRSAPLLAAALASACVTDPVTGEKHFAVVQWSVKEEQALGDQAAPNFEQQFDGALADAAAQDYLGSVIKEMANHSVRKDDFAYKFEILNSSEPNAFALPGGYVYITRGLLVNLESEGEFVAVLGHELGHVEHKHSMLQQNKTLFAGVVVSAIGVGAELLKLDPDQAQSVSALAGQGAPLLLLHYSRAQESEADQRGVFFANAMGYDPREMKKTFEYFQRLEQQAGASTPSFLRSHPTNAQRLHDIDSEIAKTAPEALAKKSDQFRAPPGPDDKFVKIVKTLQAKAPAHQKNDQAQQILAKSPADAKALAQAAALADEARKLAPDEALFEITAGEVAYAQGGGDHGRSHFEKALAMEAKAGGRGHWKPHFYLGALDVDAKRGASAAASLSKAIALFPDHPVAHYYLGRARELEGKKQDAAKEYQLVTELAPQDSALAQKSQERLAALQGPPPSPAAGTKSAPPKKAR